MGSPPGEPPRGRQAAPYVGLSPYAEADAGRFFGRSAERDLVIANLLTSRLTVMYGRSGVGKSSLLRAGVLPRLRAGADLPARGSRRAVVLVDAWQDDPAGAILRAVATATGGSDGDRDRNLPFDEALAQHAQRAGGILLLVLDQFEEYFLYHGDDDPLRAELPIVLGRPDIRVRVLFSLREDALADLDGLGAPAFGNLLRLGPMSDAAAIEAITRPLDGEAAAVEPGLPERVLELLHERAPTAGAAHGVRVDARDGIEPAYLQLVMRRLWDREVRDGSAVLRIGTLDSMGSLREIVSTHLAEAMGRLAPPEQRTMAQAFHYMVTPSGAKIAQRRDDLAQLAGVPETQIAAPLDKLAAADARILRPVDDVPSYEIFHDVLAQPVLDWQARFQARQLQRRAAALGVLFAAAAAIVLALAAYIVDPGWLRKAELLMVDARFALRGTVAPDPDVAIVDLDDASLAALGGGAARIPRRLHARMIDRLRAAGAAVIAYDIEFLDASPADAELRGAIDRAGPRLLLAATKVDSDGEGEVLGQPGSALPASVGYAGFPIAPDGAYRKVDDSVGLSGAARAEPLSRRLPTFAAVAARLAGDPPGRFGSTWIDYHGPAGTFRASRFADVLRGADPGRFRDKVVVVGTSARLQHDRHPTAHGGGGSMSGAEIQANAISTLRRGRPLRSLPRAGDVALIVVLGLLPTLLVATVRPWRAAALVALTAVVYLVAAQLLFSAGWILPVLYPMIALLLSAVGVFAVRAWLARGRDALAMPGAPGALA